MTDEKIDYQLMEPLWSLYSGDGECIEGKVGKYSRKKGRLTYGRNSIFNRDDLRRHLEGTKYLAASLAQRNMSNWLALDIDTIRLEIITKVRDAVYGTGVPLLLNFSGNKGYHFTIPLSRAVGAQEHRSLRKQIGQVVSDLDVENRSFRECLSIPCGYHPQTKNRTGFVNPDTFEYCPGPDRMEVKGRNEWRSGV